MSPPGTPEHHNEAQSRTARLRKTVNVDSSKSVLVLPQSITARRTVTNSKAKEKRKTLNIQDESSCKLAASQRSAVTSHKFSYKRASNLNAIS